jgi:hypothetical protein
MSYLKKIVYLLACTMLVCAILGGVIKSESPRAVRGYLPFVTKSERRGYLPFVARNYTGGGTEVRTPTPHLTYTPNPAPVTPYPTPVTPNPMPVTPYPAPATPNPTPATPYPAPVH